MPPSAALNLIPEPPSSSHEPSSSHNRLSKSYPTNQPTNQSTPTNPYQPLPTPTNPHPSHPSARRLSRMTDRVASGILGGVVTTSGFVTGSLLRHNFFTTGVGKFATTQTGRVAGKAAMKIIPGEVAVVSLDAFSELGGGGSWFDDLDLNFFWVFFGFFFWFFFLGFFWGFRPHTCRKVMKKGGQKSR